MNLIEYYFKKKYSPGYEVTWTVPPLFIDTYRPSKQENDGTGESITVAKLLQNWKHSLEIIPSGDGAVPIHAIRVYRPPLQ